jgi:hypothetical protein
LCEAGWRLCERRRGWVALCEPWREAAWRLCEAGWRLREAGVALVRGWVREGEAG